MRSDRASRSIISGVLFLGAFFFAIIFFTEVFSALSARPAPAPQTGISAEGWFAFLKAIGAAILAFLFAKSAILIAKPSLPEPNESEGAVQRVAQTASKAEPQLAYHAIVSRTDDGRVGKDYVIGFVRFGEKGYTPAPEFGRFISYAKAQDKAESLNDQLGLSKGEASRLISRWC